MGCMSRSTCKELIELLGCASEAARRMDVQGLCIKLVILSPRGRLPSSGGLHILLQAPAVVASSGRLLLPDGCRALRRKL